MMRHSFTLYVPSQTRDGQIHLALQESLANGALAMMAQLFGGATMDTPSKGAWIGPDGQMVVERVIKVRAFAEDRDKVSDVFRLAFHVGSKLAQQSIAVEVDGALRLIELAPHNALERH